MARDDERIPTGRVARTAKVGTVIGSQGARYAGTRAANVVRSKERATEKLDKRHLEAAERMVDTLGTMKGAAMKIGQLASFIDTEFLPPEYRELYQEKLGSLRTSAPPMPWKKVRTVLDDEWGADVEELFDEFEEEAAAAASIGQVHRAVLPDGRSVAVKIQYPGIAKALRADMQNAGMILRLAKALAPGLDAKAAAEELKARVLEELDYEYEAQNQRTFARAYRGHPFIYVPDVISRLTTERVLVTEWVDGVVKALHDLGFLRKPKRIDAERMMEHVKTVGGWYMEDRELTIDSELVMRAISAVTDPRSAFYDLMRRENVPANELMGRRMESGVLAVLGQLGATRNWYRIGREWWFADPPATELGEQEWAYFESRGERRGGEVSAPAGG